MSFVHPSQFSNILLNVSLLQDSISTWIYHLPFPSLPFSFPFASLLLSIHIHSISYDLKYHLHSYNFQFKSPISCLISGFIYPTAHLTSLEYQQAFQILHIWTQLSIPSPRIASSLLFPVSVPFLQSFQSKCSLSSVCFLWSTMKSYQLHFQTNPKSNHFSILTAIPQPKSYFSITGQWSSCFSFWLSTAY